MSQITNFGSSGGGGGGDITTINGNIGSVTPSGGVVNIVGDGTVLSSSGSGSTLTFTSTAVRTAPTSSGTATASGNAITFVGAGGITTSASGSTVTITGAGSGTVTLNYTAVSSSPYVVQATDDFLGVDTSTIAITIQLPDAPATGRTYVVKDATGNAITHNMTVTTVGGAVLIDGATSVIMNTNYESLQFLFNGTAYLIY